MLSYVSEQQLYDQSTIGFQSFPAPSNSYSNSSNSSSPTKSSSSSYDVNYRGWTNVPNSWDHQNGWNTNYRAPSRSSLATLQIQDDDVELPRDIIEGIDRIISITGNISSKTNTRPSSNTEGKKMGQIWKVFFFKSIFL